MIREEEYISLREEHEKNRSYMFERPLIVLGIIAASTQYLLSSLFPKSLQELEVVQNVRWIPLIIILPAFIGILYYNLVFVSQRLKSDARIVAYIQLFHENELFNQWIGWETSLRFYRNLKEPFPVAKVEDSIDFNPLAKVKDIINKKRTEKKESQTGFYPLIFWFHLFLMTFIFIVWICVAYTFGIGISYGYLLLVILFILFIPAYLLLLIKCFKRLPLSHSMNLLENERDKWLFVHKQNKENWKTAQMTREMQTLK